MSAAVVLLAHGLGEGLALCPREPAVDAEVLLVGVPIALWAFEMTALCDRPVLAAVPAPAPVLEGPFAAVVFAGLGEPVAVDGDVEGELEVDGLVEVLVDGDGEIDVELDGLGEPDGLT